MNQSDSLLFYSIRDSKVFAKKWYTKRQEIPQIDQIDRIEHLHVQYCTSLYLRSSQIRSPIIFGFHTTIEYLTKFLVGYEFLIVFDSFL